jgi:aminopeptidase N
MRVLITTLLFASFTYLSFGQCSHRNHQASSYFSQENLRSDTIDVLKYDIYLDLSNISTAQLSANSIVSFQAKMSGVNSLTLDLEGLTVDSVIYNAQQVPFIQQDSIMRISFSNELSTSNNESVHIFYHGNPIMDPSGWGGVYFSGGYAFNLGVGFDSKPHNYGRPWHPCFDNFV